ncbi:amino acid ABC transporter substrate-binding protein, PAAT family [Polaromonas sp. OV174]|uniref:transporter substrate-binding domain-containing protein n=1 Tax=Polaromonas sp. OV174 TaxID=1855300 RepID=UPI0008DFDE3C|nr:transporter substrate-binding domain-containing protein [Polaromonas sp. OV174]SFC72579.1 amino acid ABC transporter substrate-binding protein, PAAT family [Polaromonas sp. OV174]
MVKKLKLAAVSIGRVATSGINTAKAADLKLGVLCPLSGGLGIRQNQGRHYSNAAYKPASITYIQRDKTMKKSFRQSLLIGASVFMLMTGFTTARADQLDTIKADGALKCGVTPNNVPFSFVEDPKTRQLVGYDVDVCSAIAAEMGVKPEFVFVTSATRISDLQQGRTDIALSALTNTAVRASLIDFTQNYLHAGVRVVVSATSPIKSFADLAGKRISGTDGANLEIKLPKVIDKPELKAYPSPANAFLALDQGKVDAMAGDDTTLLGLIGPTGGKYVLLDQFVTKDQLGLGVRKGEPRVLAAVNKALTNLESSGKAGVIFEKWFGQGSKLKMKRSFTIAPYQPS